MFDFSAFESAVRFQSQEGYSESSSARSGFEGCLTYERALRGVPPGTEDVSLSGAAAEGVGLEGAIGVVETEDVDGKNGSEKGWVAPGVEELMALGEEVPSVVVEGGGVAGAAFFVAGTVATVRREMRGVCVWICEGSVVLEHGRRLVMRCRSVRRQLEQIIMAICVRVVAFSLVGY